MREQIAGTYALETVEAGGGVGSTAVEVKSRGQLGIVRDCKGLEQETARGCGSLELRPVGIVEGRTFERSKGLKLKIAVSLAGLRLEIAEMVGEWTREDVRGYR